MKSLGVCQVSVKNNMSKSVSVITLFTVALIRDGVTVQQSRVITPILPVELTVEADFYT